MWEIKEGCVLYKIQLNYKYVDNFIGCLFSKVDNTQNLPRWFYNRLNFFSVPKLTPVENVIHYLVLECSQFLKVYDYDRFLSKKFRLLQSKFFDGKNDLLRYCDSLHLFYEDIYVSRVGGFELNFFSFSKSSSNIFLEVASFKNFYIKKNFLYYKELNFFLNKITFFLNYISKYVIQKCIFFFVYLLRGVFTGCLIHNNIFYHCKNFLIIRKFNFLKTLGFSPTRCKLEEFFLSIKIYYLCKNDDIFYILIPFFRIDLKNEIDVIGDFIRFYGIDNIKKSNIKLYLKYDKIYHTLKNNLSKIMNYLICNDYNQIINYSFIDVRKNLNFEIGTLPVHIVNPISQDMAVMRISLLPGLLEVLQYNQFRKQSRVKLFEFGKKYFFQKNTGFLKQIDSISGLCYGSVFSEQWGCAVRLYDFFDFKNEVFLLCKSLGKDLKIEFRKREFSFLDSLQSLSVYINTKYVGFLGLMCSSLLKSMKIKGSVYVFELNLSFILINSTICFKAFSKFPIVRRDISIVIQKEIKIGCILDFFSNYQCVFLVKVILFDVFESYSKSQKSVSFGLFFQHPACTLTDDKLIIEIKNILNLLEKRFGGVLRDST